MKILVIAPQPFYEERGTLIAIDLLLRALAERGEVVDILTFHLGEDREYTGARLFRISPWPRPKAIKPGLSMAKLWCDLFLFFFAFRLIWKGDYDLIHGVEEAGFMAVVLGKLFRLPFVLDVDSSMTTQIVDRANWLSPLGPAMRWLESIPARNAAVVVPMCDSLAADIARLSKKKIFVLNDVCLPGDDSVSAEDIREALEFGDELMVMYVGNLEPYQGIDLLLQSFARVIGAKVKARLVIIGGRADDIAKYSVMAEKLAIGAHVNLIGTRPVGALDKYLKQADVLVSPRIQGTNTPMKVYSYLGSGRAIVATDLQTHTQVMDESTAALATPDVEAYSAAMIRILTNEEYRTRIGRQAAELADEKYSWPAFKKQVNVIFDYLHDKISTSTRTE